MYMRRSRRVVGPVNREREKGGKMMDVDISKGTRRENGKTGEDRKRGGQREEISRGDGKRRREQTENGN